MPPCTPIGRPGSLRDATLRGLRLGGVSSRLLVHRLRRPRSGGEPGSADRRVRRRAPVEQRRDRRRCSPRSSIVVRAIVGREPAAVRDPRRRRPKPATAPPDRRPGRLPDRADPERRGRLARRGHDPAAAGDIHLGHPGRTRRLRRRSRLPDRRRLDELVNVSGGSGAIPAGTVARPVRGVRDRSCRPDRRPRRRRRRRRPRRPRPTIAEDRDRPGSGPGLLHDVGRRRRWPQHEPFVLVFATPAFCTSKQCGPTLDGIKAVAKTDPGSRSSTSSRTSSSTSTAGSSPCSSADNQLQATDAVKAWGIVSEPWVFVVDGQGIVRGSFEAVVSPTSSRPRSPPPAEARPIASGRPVGTLGAPVYGASSRRYTHELAVLRPEVDAGPGRPPPCAPSGGPAGTRRRSRACRSRT